MNKIVLLVLMIGCCPVIAAAQQSEPFYPNKPATEPPVIDYIAISTVDYCVGDCIPLSPHVTGEVTTFSWNIPEAVSMTAGTDYKITACFNGAGSFPATLVVSNSSGSDSMTLYVLLNPNPTPILTESDGVLTVSGTGIVYYTWFLNGAYLTGSTSNTLTPTVEGWYRCNAQAMWGCDAWSDSMFVTPAGISSVAAGTKPDFWISGQTLYAQNPFAQPITLTIIDAGGRMLLRRQISFTKNYGLPELPAGRYLLGIHQGSDRPVFLKWAAGK